MLVLTRKKGESIVIDGHIQVKVLDVCGSRVKIGIEAPQHIPIVRSETEPRLHAELAISTSHMSSETVSTS